MRWSFRQTLSARFLLPLLTVIVAVLGASYVLRETYISKVLARQALQRSRHEALLERAHLHAFLSQEVTVARVVADDDLLVTWLRSLSRSQVTAPGALREIEHYCREFRARNCFLIAADTGQVRFSEPELGLHLSRVLGVRQATPAYQTWQAALQDPSAPVRLAVETDPYLGMRRLWLAATVHDGRGHLLGLFGSSIPLEHLQAQMLQEADRDHMTLLLNSDGRIQLMTSPESWSDWRGIDPERRHVSLEAMLQPASRNTLRRMIRSLKPNGPDVTGAFLRMGNREWVAGLTPLPDLGWYVVTLSPSALGVNDELMPLLLLDCLLITVGVLVLALLFDRWVLRRLHQLELATEQLAAGEEPSALRMSGEDEIGRLHDRFLRMADRVRAALMTLEQQHLQLTQALQSRTRFLSRMNHELRTPLAALLGLAHNLQAGLYGPLPDQARHRLDSLVCSGEMMQALVNDLLDIAQLESGDLDFRPIPLELGALVRETVELIQPLAEEAGLTLEGPLQHALVDCTADARLMRQLLLNLLQNAIRYTPAGGRVTVGLQPHPRDPQRVQLSVCDTGIGIPEPDRERVFDEFVRLPAASARVERGSGLGLPIVRRITQLHEALLELSDNQPQGTCIRVGLTAIWKPQDPPEPVLPPSSSPQAALTTAMAPELLLVEDEFLLGLPLQDWLTARGWPVTWVTSGEQAQELWTQRMRQEQALPVAVLLDVGLPGLRGSELLQWMRRQTGGDRLVILAITGYAQAEEEESIRALGVDDFLAKPIAYPELETRLGRLLHRDLPV